MKGCLRFNFGLEHKLSITQCNMETVVIESVFVKDRGEVILSNVFHAGSFFSVPKDRNLHSWGHYVT